MTPRATVALSAVAIALAGCGGGGTLFRVPSESMSPTLKIGQIMTVDKNALPPRLGDIVIFHPPIEAVEAVTGNCPDPRQGRSGREPCGVAGSRPARQSFIKRVVGLPGDGIAIVGGRVIRNGRPLSEPYIGPCSGGLCDFPKPITVPPGTYFVLGDNRGASYDSRFWGPVRRSWLIGLAKR